MALVIAAVDVVDCTASVKLVALDGMVDYLAWVVDIAAQAK